MTHIVGMQPANQGDYSKCLWGDIDRASAPWPNQKDTQQPASQIYAPKLWAGPHEPPKPVPQHIGGTLMKNVLPRASQTSNRPHAKLPIIGLLHPRLPPSYIQSWLSDSRGGWKPCLAVARYPLAKCRHVIHLVRRFTQRMDLRERSGATCVSLHFRSVGVTCVNLCLRPQDLRA